MRRAVIIFSIVAAAMAVFLLLRKTNLRAPEVHTPSSSSKARVGALAPDFALPALGGRTLRLAEHRGKVVFLNFWASWCSPCRQEMDSMESLYRRLKGRHFEILAVSIDEGGEGLVRDFVSAYSLTFPILLDPQRRLFGPYDLTGVPETFIIDRDGEIALKIIGPQDWMKQQWLDYFDRATQEKSE